MTANDLLVIRDDGDCHHLVTEAVDDWAALLQALTTPILGSAVVDRMAQFPGGNGALRI
jgi:hypothetical protein